MFNAGDFVIGKNYTDLNSTILEVERCSIDNKKLICTVRVSDKFKVGSLKLVQSTTVSLF